MMVQRLYKFIVVLLLLVFENHIKAQIRHLSVVPAPVVFVKYNMPKQPLINSTGAVLPATVPFPSSFSALPVQAIIEPDYYTRHFGFFCKKELQFEKATAVKLRVRLGDLQYVNRLEGK